MQGFKRHYLFLVIFLLGVVSFAKVFADQKPAPINNASKMTLINNPANIGENGNEIEYLRKYRAMQQLPQGATSIQVASVEEKKKLMNLLDKEKLTIGKNIKLIAFSENNTLIDNQGQGVEVYKGDFSNQGYTEYLFLASGNNGDSERIAAVFRLDNDKLTRMDFDGIIKSNLKLNDITNFYTYMAEPIGIIKDKKTYLRFMNLPDNFDRSKLVMCVYLWQGDKFTLVGPDVCVGSKAALVQNNNPKQKIK